MENYEVLKSLATGGSGVVKLARKKSNNSLVAIKLMPYDTVEDVRCEEDILSSCTHHNIISLLGVHSDCYQSIASLIPDYKPDSQGPPHRVFSMVFEYMDRGDLHKHIAKAASRLHSKGIMHLDIKSANVLLNSEGVIKLADFGHATRIDSLNKQSPFHVGTVSFLAPELILGLKDDGPQADVWSAGCVFLDLLTGWFSISNEESSTPDDENESSGPDDENESSTSNDENDPSAPDDESESSAPDDEHESSAPDDEHESSASNDESEPPVPDDESESSTPDDKQESSRSYSSCKRRIKVMNAIIYWLGKPTEENWPGVSTLPKYEELIVHSSAEEGPNDFEPHGADICNAGA